MTPPVKAALISEVGALLYILAWVIAMQWALEYMQGTPEKAWVARAWRWGQVGVGDAGSAPRPSTTGRGYRSRHREISRSGQPDSPDPDCRQYHRPAAGQFPTPLDRYHQSRLLLDPAPPGNRRRRLGAPPSLRGSDRRPDQRPRGGPIRQHPGPLCRLCPGQLGSGCGPDHSLGGLPRTQPGTVAALLPATLGSRPAGDHH